jgi:hypothetical protein
MLPIDSNSSCLLDVAALMCLWGDHCGTADTLFIPARQWLQGMTKDQIKLWAEPVLVTVTTFLKQSSSMLAAPQAGSPANCHHRLLLKPVQHLACRLCDDFMLGVCHVEHLTQP